MNSKSCGLPGSKSENYQSMLGAGSLYNRSSSLDGKTQQIINAIKRNRDEMVKLQTKTEHLEQSMLMERSLEQNGNVDSKMMEDSFSDKLELVKGEFSQQMALLKNYVHLLEKKIGNLENTIVKLTSEANENKAIDETNNSSSNESNDESKESENTDENDNNDKSDSSGENVTLNISEK